MSKINGNEGQGGEVIQDGNVPDKGSPFKTIDLYDDEEVVLESEYDGSEDEGSKTDDPFSGKSKEELAEQLRAMQAQIAAEKERFNPIKDLAEQLAKRTLEPEYRGPVTPPQPVETEDQYQQRMDLLWGSNPTKAAKEASQEQIKPLVEIMIKNQVATSKDLLLGKDDTKRLYDKWSDEIEREVMNAPITEKVQNPRIYQAALEKVKSRHLDDLINELVEQKIKERSGEGSQANVPSTPVVMSPAGQQRTAQAPGPNAKKKVIIPDWVVDEAFRQGIDEKFYFHRLKEKGDPRLR